MKVFILYDNRNSFRQDITSAMMLESYPFRLSMVKNFEELVAEGANNHDATLIASDTAMDDYESDRMQGRTVFGYASIPDGIRTLQENNVTCLGLFKTSAKLLDALSAPTLPLMNGCKGDAAVTNPSDSSHVKPASPESVSQPAVTPQAAPMPSGPAAMPTMPGMTQAQMMQMFAMFQAMQAGNQGQATTPATQSAAADAIPESSEVQATDPAPTEITKNPSRAEKKKAAREARLNETARAQQEMNADEEIDQDLLRTQVQRKKTRVVSVYAAKGGVGKTSIAAELAVCLALTSNGRRKFRVCIADYNIDFGDVASTLNLDESGPNMTYWAEEIRSSLAAGKEPDSIDYTRQDMEKYYLQRVDPRFEAYCLAAPIMHEDSMFIKPHELEVMLRNIIEHGEFDYVICDTGNNTRDSSVIALEKADYILLVATQDVTTANCNASVLRTLGDVGFDTEKIRLIVNNVMPVRDTGISVQEVEETFPYQCVCRIKRAPDLYKANNTGKPLVLYQPKHDYTKQIRRIVSFVTTGEIVHDAPKRQFFFGKKKK